MVPSKCSLEVEIVRPIDAPPLIVSAGINAQSYLRAILYKGNRNQEATIEFEVVRGDRIDLLGGISTPDESVGAPSRALAADDKHLASPRSPLALDSNQFVARREDHVKPATLGNRPIHLDPELHSGKLNCELRDGSLLIRCHARQPTDRLGWAVSV
jgi:hypothetical protein